MNILYKIIIFLKNMEYSSMQLNMSGAMIQLVIYYLW